MKVQPYVPLSLLAHGALLGFVYYFGSYQPEMREQQVEVANSLRATGMASTARSVRALEKIKELLEKSDDRAEPDAAPPTSALPQTPEELVERARELSQAIEALDQQTREEELARLSGDTALPPPPADSQTSDAPLPKDPESAAQEVAKLEARARDVLARHQRQLEAQANGVQVDGPAGSARQAEIAGTDEGNGPGAQWHSGVGTARDFHGSGTVLVPPVDASGLVRGRGRMLGPGGEYANRIYVNSWYVIGPFQGTRPGRLRGNPVYPPEQAVLLDAVYFGKNDRLLKWRYVSEQSYPLVPPDSSEHAIYYGYTEVSVPEDCDLVAWIGADDDAQVYLNDHLVWAGGTVSLIQYIQAIWDPRETHLRDYNFTEARLVLRFNKGRNKVFFKLSNGWQGTHLSFVLTR
jgi:hypothetical protein